MKLAASPARRTARRAAFTLIEVLVVVAILVILAGVGVVATTSYMDKAKKDQAVLGCKGLSAACEAYYLDTQSQSNYPQALQELVQPPFGGPSMLKNGQADLLDPWGKPYQLQVRQKNDGQLAPLIQTTAPDGTPISQYGIGNMSTPPN